MKKPLVSAIITTYKRERKVLKRAINSILKQTHENYEIIIVDDNGRGSKYQLEVEEAIRELDSTEKIKLIKHNKNSGAQKARNTGLKYSNGEFISFLDDDDEWLEKKIELQLDKFAKNTSLNLGLVNCWFYKIETLENNSTRKKIMKPSVMPSDVKEKLLYNNFIGSTSFPLIKKECFDKVGDFDESLEAKQDYDMWLRISKQFDIDYVNVPLCNYYDHSDERISKNILKKIKAEKVFYEKHQHDIDANKKAKSAKMMSMGILYLKIEKYKEAKKYLWNSIKITPINYKLYILMLCTLIGYTPGIIKKRL